MAHTESPASVSIRNPDIAERSGIAATNFV